MNKNNKTLSYWEKRAVAQEEAILRGLASKEDKIIKAYINAQRYLTTEAKKIYDRYLNKSGLSQQDVQKILNTTVAPADLVELQRLSKKISDPNVKKQIQTYLDGLAVKSRITRLEDLKAKSFLVSKQVADVQLATSTDYYIDVIRNAYNQAAAEGVIGQTVQQLKSDVDIHHWQDKVRKGGGNPQIPTYSIQNNQPVVEFYDWQTEKIVKKIALTPDSAIQEFKELSTETVTNILESNWQGSNYSKRIWQDTDKLAQRLEELLTVEGLTGMSESNMAKAIAKEFNQAFGVARRLIRTEANYLAGQAKLESWRLHGVQDYVIVAILDFRTSNICQGKDGKIYPLKEAKCDGPNGNYPPFHPWCRTVARAYFGPQTLQGERIANDPLSNETFTIKQADSYKQWEEWLIAKHGQTEVELFKKKVKNHQADQLQYKKYQSILGAENLAETLEKFQEIKYTTGNGWSELKALYRDVKWQQQSLKNLSVIDDHKVPFESLPNSVIDKMLDNEIYQRRYYGRTGKPRLDIDFNQGNPKYHETVPHAHDWTAYEKKTGDIIFKRNKTWRVLSKAEKIANKDVIADD